MTTDFDRCSECGKRLSPSDETCPACGAAQVPHVERVRCRRCGWRVRADVLTCPHCGHNPRAFYFQAWIGLALLFCLGTLIAAVLFYNARLAIIASNPTPFDVVATRAPTWTPVITVQVVTATPTFTPTRAPIPSTATPTLRPTTTVTLTPSPRPTLTRALTATHTATATRAPVPAPRLTGPDDGARFAGPAVRIRLTWVGPPLTDNQWYMVRVEYLDRADFPVAWCGWARNGEIFFPSQLRDDSSPTQRAFRWSARVMEPDSPQPETCQAPASPAGDPSGTRTFFWY